MRGKLHPPPIKKVEYFSVLLPIEIRERVAVFFSINRERELTSYVIYFRAVVDSGKRIIRPGPTYHSTNQPNRE